MRTSLAALAAPAATGDPSTRLAASSDLPPWLLGATAVLALASLVLLAVEMRRRERGGLLIAATGLLAIGALVLAVLRPVRIAARESVVGARVVVLADTSRSMALKDGSGSRADARDRAIASLSKQSDQVRLVTLGFGDGPALPWSAGAPSIAARSDLGTAVRSLAASPDERPAAIVLVSDGRLDDPPEAAGVAAMRALGDELKVPVHVIATTRSAPADASIRRVGLAGAAVAHVPLPLRIEVGCDGGLACDELTVTARELREDGTPALLASGLAHVDRTGHATLDLTVTLERAGIHVLEVALTPPSGDTIAGNDRRLLPITVSRERVRVLHVAGRPTNDVRALREWLKSDASVDVVAFFILRTPTDATNASQDELALIPFPVDELFSEHLPSFDAVVLQDFDAQPYGLERHLPAVASYVRSGGGLIMVGGANSFVAGGYAGSPLAGVLPIALDGSSGATAADTATFQPSWSEAARAAPLLAALKGVVGDELPVMPGANVLGDVRPGGVALWTHPFRKTASGAPMPVLAIGEQGNGRSIALGIDGAWRLRFSDLAARTSGRGYGAMWDGLLGWLMRDPRFEPAQIEIAACVADVPSSLRVRAEALGKARADITIEVSRMDAQMPPIHLEKKDAALGEPVDVALPALAEGGYAARVTFGTGSATLRQFACEAGGDEWADSRPDGDRLEQLAKTTGGRFFWADQRVAVPLPAPTVVSSERHVVPLAPPWLWALIAALAFGAHAIARRRGGLT